MGFLNYQKFNSIGKIASIFFNKAQATDWDVVRLKPAGDFAKKNWRLKKANMNWLIHILGASVCWRIYQHRIFSSQITYVKTTGDRHLVEGSRSSISLERWFRLKKTSKPDAVLALLDHQANQSKKYYRNVLRLSFPNWKLWIETLMREFWQKNSCKLWKKSIPDSLLASVAPSLIKAEEVR